MNENLHDIAVNRAKKTMPDDETLYDLAEMFKVFGDTTRTRIISALFSGELCVNAICDILSMQKSAVSHQLRILRQSKLVKQRKCGQQVFYSLDDEHVIKIYQMALDHFNEGKGK